MRYICVDKLCKRNVGQQTRPSGILNLFWHSGTYCNLVSIKIKLYQFLYMKLNFKPLLQMGAPCVVNSMHQFYASDFRRQCQHVWDSTNSTGSSYCSSHNPVFTMVWRNTNSLYAGGGHWLWIWRSVGVHYHQHASVQSQHSCQGTLDISRCPIDRQWSSRKYSR